MDTERPRCNRKRMRRLAKALISGKYQQARSRLRTAEGFCCLGVACDLMAKDAKKGGGRWNSQPWLDSVTYAFTDRRGHSNRFSLSEAVQKYYGLRKGDNEIWLADPKKIFDLDDERNAMLLNDTGKTFPEMARKSWSISGFDRGASVRASDRVS